MNSTLGLHGGNPVRKNPMPARNAFGDNEIRSLMLAIEYYKSKNEDPPYQGYFEEKFCNKFNEYMGGGYSDAVSSGTSAVYVALAALQLPQGSDVLISPVTDSGPLNCIILQGFNPVLVDSSSNSYNTSLEKIKERVTNNTTAFIAVHSAGEPLNIQEIVSELSKKNIRTIEDCSQAPGARSKGELVGTIGDIAAFSTMYRKTLTAGASGGLVYTKDKELYRKVLAYADRGKQIWREDINLNNPTDALFPALNHNTDDLSCSIGIASLERMDDSIAKRIDFIKSLIEKMKKSIVCSPYNFTQNFSPFYFPVFVDESKIKCDKKTFALALQAEGITLGEHYGCIISDWIWAKNYMYDDFISLNAASTRDRTFNLHLNEEYGEQEVDDIINSILKIESYFLT